MRSVCVNQTKYEAGNITSKTKNNIPNAFSIHMKKTDEFNAMILEIWALTEDELE